MTGVSLGLLVVGKAMRSEAGVHSHGALSLIKTWIEYQAELETEVTGTSVASTMVTSLAFADDAVLLAESLLFLVMAAEACIGERNLFSTLGLLGTCKCLEVAIYRCLKVDLKQYSLFMHMSRH